MESCDQLLSKRLLGLSLNWVCLQAEELNLTMKEVAEAVEIEKQRHAMTRREGLAQEAQLEVNIESLCSFLQ